MSMDTQPEYPEPKELQAARKLHKELQAKADAIRSKMLIAVGTDRARLESEHEIALRAKWEAGAAITPLRRAWNKLGAGDPSKSKRAAQEEYVKRFDGETPVKIGNEITTLRAWHHKRLFGK